MSDVKKKLSEFLKGLDSTSRSRLKALGLAAFEQYATSFPGPDGPVKNIARPHVEKFIDNAIEDLCS